MLSEAVVVGQRTWYHTANLEAVDFYPEKYQKNSENGRSVRPQIESKILIKSDFLCQLIYVGIIHFCNLSALNYGLKSLLATLSAAAVLVSISSSLGDGAQLRVV